MDWSTSTHAPAHTHLFDDSLNVVFALLPLAGIVENGQGFDEIVVHQLVVLESLLDLLNVPEYIRYTADHK